jgi:hypothetical protein
MFPKAIQLSNHKQSWRCFSLLSTSHRGRLEGNWSGIFPLILMDEWCFSKFQFPLHVKSVKFKASLTQDFGSARADRRMKLAHLKWFDYLSIQIFLNTQLISVPPEVTCSVTLTNSVQNNIVLAAFRIWCKPTSCGAWYILEIPRTLT